jgi:phosphoribosyl-ATP pyrophosphohydrolase
MSSNDALARLAAVIESRRGGDPDQSYVARLFAKGTDAILKKVGEEATEVVMAGKDGDRPEDRLRGGRPVVPLHGGAGALRADGPADVLAELERREGLSGLEEFAQRKAACVRSRWWSTSCRH